MKKSIFILIYFILPIASFSQDVIGTRVIARQSLFVKDNWVDSLRRDSSNWANDFRTLPTTGAVYKFVVGRIGSGTPGLGTVTNVGTGYGLSGGPITGTGTIVFDSATVFPQIRATIPSGGGSVNSVLGTANRITSSGGANPVIDIAATYVGQTSITTLGTIATGVWNGTAIANANLANSSLTIGSTAISLGATSTTLAGLTSVTSTTFSGSLSGNATTATALATGRTISISGDLTYASPLFDGSGNVTAAGTLATVNSNVGTFGGATQSTQFTVNGKGLITAVSNVTVTPAESSITFTDITTNNVSSSAHGFMPKLTANRVYYVDNSGVWTALALGGSGTVLTSNGATSAPTFTTPAGGGISSLTDVGGGLGVQTGGAGNVRTIAAADFNVTGDLISLDYTNGPQRKLIAAKSVVIVNDSIRLAGENPNELPLANNTAYSKVNEVQGWNPIAIVNGVDEDQDHMLKFDSTNNEWENFKPDTLLGTLRWRVGVTSGFPDVGETTILDSNLMGKRVDVFVDRQLLYEGLDYTHNPVIGEIEFTEPLEDSVPVVIKTTALMISTVHTRRVVVPPPEWEDFDYDDNTNLTESPANVWQASTGSGYGQTGLNSLYKLLTGTEGAVRMQFSNTDQWGRGVLGLDVTDAEQGYASMSAAVLLVDNGTSADIYRTSGSESFDTGFDVAEGDWVALWRYADGTIVIRKSTNGVDWIDVHSYGVVSTADLYLVCDIHFQGGAQVGMIKNPQVLNKVNQ